MLLEWMGMWAAWPLRSKSMTLHRDLCWAVRTGYIARTYFLFSKKVRQWDIQIWVWFLTVRQRKCRKAWWHVVYGWPVGHVSLGWKDMDTTNMSQNTEQSKAHVKACDSNENKMKRAGTSSVQYCYCIQYYLQKQYKNNNNIDIDTETQFFCLRTFFRD